MYRAILVLLLASVGIGCAVSSDDPVTTVGIPQGAVVVEDGTGRLDYRPDRDGHVYLYDVDDERLVYEQRINAGDEFIADTKANSITLNSRRLTDRSLKSNHAHRLYFKSSK